MNEEDESTLLFTSPLRSLIQPNQSSHYHQNQQDQQELQEEREERQIREQHEPDQPANGQELISDSSIEQMPISESEETSLLACRDVRDNDNDIGKGDGLVIEIEASEASGAKKLMGKRDM